MSWHQDARRLAVLVLVASGAMAGSCGSALADASPDVISVIRAALVRNRLVTPAQARCLDYLTDVETPEHVDVDVHERHGSGCPGDPGTSPRLLSVRYEKKSRRILLENADEGRYNPLR